MISNGVYFQKHSNAGFQVKTVVFRYTRNYYEATVLCVNSEFIIQGFIIRLSLLPEVFSEETQMEMFIFYAKAQRNDEVHTSPSSPMLRHRYCALEGSPTARGLNEEDTSEAAVQ